MYYILRFFNRFFLDSIAPCVIFAKMLCVGCSFHTISTWVGKPSIGRYYTVYSKPLTVSR